MSLSRFSGQYRAVEFNYGGGFEINPAPLTVISAPGASGAQTATVAQGFISLSDGTIVSPLATTAPIYIGSATLAETVTPSAVSNNVQSNVFGQTATVTATFSNAHYAGDRVCSGTFGLQEAINFAASKGGGTVIVDAAWTTQGGTSTILGAASVPSTVQIMDNRVGSFSPPMTATVAIPNAQVLTLSTVGVPLIAAPGAGNLIVVDRIVVEQIALTGAFTGGGNITAAYGTQASQTACTGTIAATVFTAGSGTANQIGMAVGVAPANGASSGLVNKAVGLYAASTDFAAGGGSGICKITYRILQGF
jgi:hypothetical protein